MEDVTPQEAKINAMLQVVAILIDRLGGEVVINLKEYSAFEDVVVKGRNLSPGYVVLHLDYDDEDEEFNLAGLDIE